jgi:hypothetical protein
MPPGPVYNWLAVAHSALVILDHALQYRAAQVTGSIRVSQQSRQRGAPRGVYEKTQEEVKDVGEIVPSTADEPLSFESTHVQPSSLLHANEAWLRQLEIPATPRTSSFESVSEPQIRGDTTVASILLEPSSSSVTVPGVADTRPPAAEPMPAADVNISRPDAPLPQHLPMPESGAPVDDVLLINYLNFLYILNPYYCRCLRLGLNHREAFSLPKCLLLASGDFSITEVSTFVPTSQRGS